MKLKKWLSLVAAVTVLLSLSACGNGANAVYVQSVRELNRFGGIAPGDRFPGMVVSENTTEINKDGDKSIEKLHVKEGQDVKEGDILFSFGDEEITLQLGDELAVAAVIEDQYGREFLVADNALTLMEEANELVWAENVDTLLCPPGYEY